MKDANSRPIVPWLDNQGFMVLDVKRDFSCRQVWVRVRVQVGPPAYRAWVLVQECTVDAPHTRAARRQLLRTYADLASIQLGYPHRLRSKLKPQPVPGNGGNIKRRRP